MSKLKNVLAIDTSTNQIAIGLFQFGKPDLVLTKNDSLRHAEYASVLIQKIIKESGLNFSEVDAITCGIGPGPFTGLRVGIVSAQVIGHALNIPVYGVCSHDAIAYEHYQNNSHQESTVITDARRKEVYWTQYRFGKRISTPKVSKLEDVEIIGFGKTFKTTVTGVEMFRKTLDNGEAGDNVGLLLRGIKKEDIERGMVIVKPGSITPHRKFKAEIYVLTKDEGGRHSPFFSGYRPQFYLRTTDVTGVVTLEAGREMVMPGDNVCVEVELIAPIAMEKDLHFSIREGGRTVGSGVVSEIIQ